MRVRLPHSSGPLRIALNTASGLNVLRPRASSAKTTVRAIPSTSIVCGLLTWRWVEELCEPGAFMLGRPWLAHSSSTCCYVSRASRRAARSSFTLCLNACANARPFDSYFCSVSCMILSAAACAEVPPFTRVRSAAPSLEHCEVQCDAAAHTAHHTKHAGSSLKRSP